MASGELEPFQTIYCDPPWRYANQATRNATSKHYPSMPFDEICGLPVEKLAGSKCLLWLWTTVAFRRQAEELIEAWGFTFRSEMIWDKINLGLGNFTRLQHEYLLIANRGGQRTLTRNLRSIIREKRGRHSAKPELVRRMIEINSEPPRIELFGRARVHGWTVFGNQNQSRDDEQLAWS